jgi:hypothetical protein
METPIYSKVKVMKPVVSARRLGDALFIAEQQDCLAVI